MTRRRPRRPRWQRLRERLADMLGLPSVFPGEDGWIV